MRALGDAPIVPTPPARGSAPVEQSFVALVVAAIWCYHSFSGWVAFGAPAVKCAASSIGSMKLRYQLGLFLTATIVMSAVAVVIAILHHRTHHRQVAAEQLRFNSILLADELRQSSDDLTKFARLFVQTGEKRFEDYFRQVLAIRNGELPRPEGYEGIYWDRVVVEGVAKGSKNAGAAVSLRERMAQLKFAESEFALLAEAQVRSDALVNIENRAFNAVRGLFDDGSGNFVRRGKPDPELAQRLLYGDDYLRAKAFIMEPIRRFEESVNARTTALLTVARNEAASLMWASFVATGSLLALLVALSAVIDRRVLLRAGTLADAAGRIGEGRLDVRSGVRGNDELGILGATFDDMVSRLEENLNLVTAAKDRMEYELGVGRGIQMSLVPLIFPPFPAREEFSVYATLEPAREVGGDFYNFFFIDENRFCVCVGDVSGKGVPAALFMAVAMTLIKSRATDDLSTASILTHMNDEVSADNRESMFVTLFIAIIDIRSGEVVFTNAGHNPPYVRREGGALQRLDTRHGPVIGAMEGMVYGEDRMNLRIGDMLFLYTDGVTEAMDARDRLFSEERLVALLESGDAATAEAAVDATVSAVKAFEGGAEQTDDITVLAFQFHGVAGKATQARWRVVIKNRLSEIAAVTEGFERFADDQGIPAAVAMKFNIAFDELLNNVIAYAYRDEDEHEIVIQAVLSRERLTVTIFDDGVPFNPLSVKAPDTQSPLEDREPGGLGVHLVRGLVDELSYRRYIDGNALTLVKLLDREAA